MIQQPHTFYSTVRYAYAWLLAVTLVCACGARTELDDGDFVSGGANDVSNDAVRDAAVGDECLPNVTTTLQIPITSPWFDTGIDVAVGTELTIHAAGIVRYGPHPPQTTDANGGNFDGQQFFSSAVLPDVIICSLIGKVGGTTTIGTGTTLPVGDGVSGKGAGFVGIDYHAIVTTAGRLFLGFNDQTGDFGDNSGAFTVTITTSDSC